MMLSKLEVQDEAEVRCAGVLPGRIESGHADGSLFSKYMCASRTSVKLKRKYENRTRYTYWEIGSRDDTIKPPAVTGSGGILLAGKTVRNYLNLGSGYYAPTTMRIPTEWSDRLKESAGKSFVNQADWSKCDFASVVKCLGGMAAGVCLNPTLSTKDFLDGGEYSIIGSTVPAEPRTCSENMVYLPQGCLTHEAWRALACAVNMTGSDVLTETSVIGVDSRSRDIHITGCSLWRGISLALNYLSSFMSICNQGGIYGLALACGIHSVITVVAHSDEGGLMRDLLRKIGFAPAHGGFPKGLAVNPKMAVVYDDRHSMLKCYVDTIALTTAATVCHADPCVTTLDFVGPTTLTGNSALGPRPDTVGKKKDEEASKTWLTAHKNKLVDELRITIGDFGRIYAKCLAKLFGLSEDEDSQLASCILAIGVEQLHDVVENRHLNEDTVFPFYWIEPSGLLPVNAFGTDAERYGLASLGNCDNGDVTLPFFEELVPTGFNSGMTREYVVRWSGARRSGAVLWHDGHIGDGLAFYKIVGADTQSIVGSGMTLESLKTSIKDGKTIADHVWTRGQAKFPHPGEMLVVDNALVIRYTRPDDADLEGLKGLSTPDFFDFESNPRTITEFSRIANAPSGASNYENKKERRARTQAVTTLRNIAIRKQLFTTENGVDGFEARDAPISHLLPKSKIVSVSDGRPLDYTRKQTMVGALDDEERAVRRVRQRDMMVSLAPTVSLSSSHDDRRDNHFTSKGKHHDVVRLHGTQKGPIPDKFDIPAKKERNISETKPILETVAETGLHKMPGDSQFESLDGGSYDGTVEAVPKQP